MKTSKNRGTYYSPFTDMRIIGRIVGVQRTEQSVGIIVGAFSPTHKYKCRKVRQFVRVQKWRTFFVAKHTTKRSGGPFLVDFFSS